jgi:hypothetical protein
MPIKVGDNVHLMRAVFDILATAWKEEPRDKQARVMAIAEGYAMVRFPRCMPFVESVKNLERWNPEQETDR